MKAETCPWWNRGMHRRLRSIDLETIWRSIYERAERLEEAQLAWDLFMHQEEQRGHWQCPCGRPIAALFKVTILTTVNDDG